MKTARRPTVLMAHPHTDLYGSDRMFLQSVDAVSSEGWEVVVTVPGDGPLLRKLREAHQEVVVCPTPVLRKVALHPRGFLELLATTARFIGPAIRLIRRVRPDIVYVNTVVAPAWALLARILGARVVVHVHEAEDSLPRPVQIILTAPLLAAHLVLVNSRATAAAVGRVIPGLKSRFKLVYNGISGPPVRRRPSPHRPDLPRLLLVGRLSARKGVDIAVEALAILRGRGRTAQLRIIGSVFPGYEWFEEKLRKDVAGAGLGAVVRFEGFKTDIWDAYEKVDIALVPSLGESFGNTSVEAQLAGVPVIVTDAQALPETVDNGRNGAIVSAGSAGELATAVEELLDDWPATVERARRAQEWAGERFSPERYKSELVEALQSL